MATKDLEGAKSVSCRSPFTLGCVQKRLTFCLIAPKSRTPTRRASWISCYMWNNSAKSAARSGCGTRRITRPHWLSFVVSFVCSVKCITDARCQAVDGADLSDVLGALSYAVNKDGTWPRLYNACTTSLQRMLSDGELRIQVLNIFGCCS